jgi:integrase/recombinase XerD
MRLKIDWNKTPSNGERPLAKYKQYLREQGLRDSTVEMYAGNVARYLKFCGTEHPTEEDYARFKESLHSWKLGRSTLNQYGYAIKAYHSMIGVKVEYKRLSPYNYLPLYFTAEEVDRIFSAVKNLKHLAILKTLFYGCIRASELCNLNDEDLDLNSLTIRINNGKGGKSGIVYISDDCARCLKDYLSMRPPFQVDGQQPLFYTDYGHRWRREDLYHMFIKYKNTAGVTRKGGLHTWSRHAPATLMVSKGCDIRVIQKLLRHSDIRTTLRYAHVTELTARSWYDRTLKI